MPDVGHDGRMVPFAYMGANGEPPPGRDEQIGRMFRQMRAALNVPRETISRRLATSLSTIDSLEAGAIAALPHWKETARIIRGYCELLRMDPQPMLRRVHDQLQAHASRATPVFPAPPRVLRPTTAGAQAAAQPLPAAEAEPASARLPRRRRRTRALFALSAPIALVLGVAIMAQLAPGPAYRAVGLLPDPVEAPMRAGLDYITLLTAPRREGLKWIEVSDPRLRKADKLPTSTR